MIIRRNAPLPLNPAGTRWPETREPVDRSDWEWDRPSGTLLSSMACLGISGMAVGAGTVTGQTWLVAAGVAGSAAGFALLGAHVRGVGAPALPTALRTAALAGAYGYVSALAGAGLALPQGPPLVAVAAGYALVSAFWLETAR
ncbi:MAG: hypothetical protein AB1758_27685 [Candidatus Eremiobacterota bacterium]